MPPEKQQFIYVIRPSRPTFPGDATDEEREIVGQHFLYLKRLLDEGILVIAGRTMEEQPFGIAVFYADDLEHAKRITAEDPAIKAGVFVPSLHTFSIALLGAEP